MCWPRIARSVVSVLAVFALVAQIVIVVDAEAAGAASSSVSISDGGVNTRRTNAGSCAGEICHDLVYSIQGISKPYTLECWFYGRNSQKTYNGRSWRGSWSGRADYGCYRYASYCGTIYVKVNNVRSNTISINQSAPDAPGRPEASAGNRQISVSWLAPSPNCAAISSYEVQWRRSGSSSWSQETTSSRSYTISGLRDGTDYDIQVRARNSRGWGSWSPSASVTTQQQRASAPSRVAKPSVLTNGRGSLSVSWSAPSSNGAAISSYQVQWRRSGSSSWSQETTSNTSNRSYTISGLRDGTAYEVQVRARNSGGWGTWSRTAHETTQVAVSVPGKVTGVSVTAGVQSLTVRWNAPPDGGAPITDYDIRWGHLNNANWHDWEPSVVSTRRQTTISVLTAGADFKVSVRAKNTAGAGPWSDRAWGTPTQAVSVPGQVAQPSVSANGRGSLSVSWSAPSSNGAAISSYEVKWRRSGTSSWSQQTTSSRNYAISGLADGTVYEVQVRARNSAGWGTWSPSGQGPTQVSVSVSGRVTGVSVTAGLRSLTVTWNAPPDGGAPITDYDVRYIGDDLLWRIWQPSVVSTSRQATITGLSAAENFAVQVRAKNAVGAGPWSDSVGGTPTASVSVSVPGRVGRPSVEAGDRSLTVSWDAPADGGSAIVDYDVRYVDSGYIGCAECGPLPWVSWEPSVVSTSRQVTIMGLAAGTSYAVEVRAKNSAGAGEWSYEQDGTPTASVMPPGEVTGVSVSAGDQSLTVTWNAPSGGNTPIVDYGVRWRRSGDSWSQHVTSSTSYTITGLRDHTAYEVQVRARNGAGWGSWSPSATATTDRRQTQSSVPATVTGLSVVPGDGSLTLSWDIPDDAGSPIIDYDVQYWDGQSWVDWAKAIVDTSAQATITGLTTGQPVAVRVRASNSVGSGTWSDYVWGTPSMSLPGRVTGLTVVPDINSLQVSWSAPADSAQIVGYELFYSRDSYIWSKYLKEWLACESECGVPPGPSSPLVTTVARQVTIEGLNAHTQYLVSVRPKYSTGLGPWSDWDTATPISVPATVAGLHLRFSDESLLVNWDEPHDGGRQIDHYDVGYYVGIEWHLKKIRSNSRQATIPGLDAGTDVTVYVRATNSVGDGEWSEPASRTVPSVTSADLGEVQVVRAEYKGSWCFFGCYSRKLDIKWKRVPVASGYEIVYWYRTPYGNTKDGAKLSKEVNGKLESFDEPVPLSKIIEVSKLVCDSDANKMKWNEDNHIASTSKQQTHNFIPGCDGGDTLAGIVTVDESDTTELTWEDIDPSGLEFRIRAVYTEDGEHGTAGPWSVSHSIARQKLPNSCRNHTVLDNLESIGLLAFSGSIAENRDDLGKYVKPIKSVNHIYTLLEENKCGGSFGDIFEEALLALPGKIGILAKIVSSALKLGRVAGDAFNKLKCAQNKGIRNVQGAWPNEPFMYCNALFSGR